MIEVNDLVKQYGDHTAVDHLSFQVEKGQIYGFLGPNGAGKSTTMNIMTGYLSATSGEVLINGHNIFEEPEEAKKCIGYLPEIPPLYMDMTPLEYLKFVAELKKIPKKEQWQMIADVMKLVKITDYSHRLIRNLSKGYRQRVGLAQAILGYPEIIILDEPTVGLDPKQIIEIRDLIKELSKKHTVILSSHIMQEISAVCDYVMIIAHGKLVASDTPENLSRLMLGANELQLTVKGTAEQITEILSQNEEITNLEVHTGIEEGCVNIDMKTAADVDIREKMFYQLSDARCPILMMKSANMSLEDIFLELTSDQGTEKREKKRSFFARKPKKEAEEGGSIAEDSSIAASGTAKTISAAAEKKESASDEESAAKIMEKEQNDESNL